MKWGPPGVRAPQRARGCARAWARATRGDTGGLGLGLGLRPRVCDTPLLVSVPSPKHSHAPRRQWSCSDTRIHCILFWNRTSCAKLGAGGLKPCTDTRRVASVSEWSLFVCMFLSDRLILNFKRKKKEKKDPSRRRQRHVEAAGGVAERACAHGRQNAHRTRSSPPGSREQQQISPQGKCVG